MLRLVDREAAVHHRQIGVVRLVLVRVSWQGKSWFCRVGRIWPHFDPLVRFLHAGIALDTNRFSGSAFTRGGLRHEYWHER